MKSWAIVKDSWMAQNSGATVLTMSYNSFISDLAEDSLEDAAMDEPLELGEEAAGMELGEGPPGMEIDKDLANLLEADMGPGEELDAETIPGSPMHPGAYDTCR